MVRTSTPARASALTALLICLSAQAAPQSVLRDVDAREGPGSYFPPVARVIRGTAVDAGNAQGGWREIEFDLGRAWVPARALGQPGAAAAATPDAQSRRQQLLEQLDAAQGQQTTRDGSIPWVQVTAAVRGFALSYAASRMPGTPADRTPSLLRDVDVAQYERFLSHRFSDRNRSALAEQYAIDPTAVPGLQDDALRLGTAIGTVVSQRGTLDLPAVEAYLTHVATLVAESSHVLELPVRVFVLKQAQPLGFITPNGLLFVSVGALELMQDEAEFAFFVGHEIAHVALAHGRQAAERDAQRIRESQSFDALDRELGWDDPTNDDKYARTARELGAMADAIYEVLRAESQEDWEFEADRWGMVYAYRAGYAPDAAIDLLTRMQAVQAETGGVEAASRLLWRQTPIDARIRRCKGQLRELRSGKQHRRYADEFQRGSRSPGDRRP